MYCQMTVRGGGKTMWRAILRFLNLDNERGQTSTNWLNWLNPIMQTMGGFFPQQTSSGFNFGGLQLPNSLLGAGLLGASTLFKPETLPGSQEAGQYLRNLFTSPNALSQGFQQGVTSASGALAPWMGETPSTKYLGGMLTYDPFAAGGPYSNLLPLFNQGANEQLNNVQQRYIAGLPSSLSTGMGGPEILGLREAVSRDIVPRQQALMAQLQQDALTRGIQSAGMLMNREGDIRNLMANVGLQEQAMPINAAGGLLALSRPNPLSQMLGQLGGLLMAKDLLGGGTGGGGGLFGGAGGPGAPGTGGGGGGFNLGGLFGGGAPAGQWYSQIGQLSVPEIFQQMQAGTLSTSEGMALLGKALPGMLGTAGAGFGVGNMIGGQFPNHQFAGTALGGLGGAAAGAAIGSIFPGVGTAIGAIIGGLFGGGGGLFGAHQQAVQIKEDFRKADLDSQADQVQEIGSWFTQQLGQLGVNTNDFQGFISQMIQQSPQGPSPFSFGGTSGTLDQQQAVAQVGGQLLLSIYRQVNPQITSLNQVPNLRQSFIDYLTRSTFSSPNSSFQGGAPTDQFGPWASLAGLQHGGVFQRPGMAMVGERGPELMIGQPGTAVFPLVPPQERPAMPGQIGPSIGQQLQQAMIANQITPRSVPGLLQGFGVPAHAYGPGGIAGQRPMTDFIPPPSPPIFRAPQEQAQSSIGQRLRQALMARSMAPRMVPGILQGMGLPAYAYGGGIAQLPPPEMLARRRLISVAPGPGGTV